MRIICLSSIGADSSWCSHLSHGFFFTSSFPGYPVNILVKLAFILGSFLLPFSVLFPADLIYCHSWVTTSRWITTSSRSLSPTSFPEIRTDTCWLLHPEISANSVHPLSSLYPQTHLNSSSLSPSDTSYKSVGWSFLIPSSLSHDSTSNQQPSLWILPPKNFMKCLKAFLRKVLKDALHQNKEVSQRKMP